MQFLVNKITKLPNIICSKTYKKYYLLTNSTGFESIHTSDIVLSNCESNARLKSMLSEVCMISTTRLVIIDTSKLASSAKSRQCFLSSVSCIPKLSKICDFTC